MRGDKGFALVIALIVTTLLVALLAEFVNEVYVDASHSHNFVASQQAGMLAESGIAGGIKLLQVSSALRLGEQYSSLLEPWAQPQSFDAENGKVTVTIEEETGKLNLNNATTSNGTTNQYTEIFVRLLADLKISTDLADALLDWVDVNEMPHSAGAESSYYRNLKPPYNSKNAQLDTVEELALIKGFTFDTLTKLRPFVTVYGSVDAEPSSLININTAAKEVLTAVGLSNDTVEKIVDYRKTKPISPKDLGMFDIPLDLQALFTCQGSVYRIRTEGRVGESVSVVEAVVRNVESTSPTILYWREY